MTDVAKVIVRETRVTINVDGSTGSAPAVHTHTESDITDLDHTPDPHTHTESEISDLSHTPAHASTTGKTANDHHNQVHDLGGSDHNAATLAELNAKISDANLGDDSYFLFKFPEGALTVREALGRMYVPYDITVTGWVGHSGTAASGAGDKFAITASGTADDPLSFATTVIADTNAAMGDGAQRGSTATVTTPNVDAGSYIKCNCTGIAGTPGQNHHGYLLYKRR